MQLHVDKAIWLFCVLYHCACNRLHFTMIFCILLEHCIKLQIIHLWNLNRYIDMSGNFVTKWISWSSLVLKGNRRGDYMFPLCLSMHQVFPMFYTPWMEFRDIYFLSCQTLWQKNIHLGHNFWTIRYRDFIFGCILN